MSALTFSELEADNLEKARPFASLPFNSFLKCSREPIESRWLDALAELLRSEDSFGIVAERDATLCGFAICAPLPWESALFGKPMWAIKHIGVDAECANVNSVATGLVVEVSRRAATRQAQFLLCKTAPADTAIIHALESNDFHLMDTLLDFVCDCRAVRAQGNLRRLPEGFILRRATSNDVEDLVETARASFAKHFGRFHADPRIGHAFATKVYEEWIRSCVNGWADFVFVATRDDRITGYSAWKKPSALDIRYGLRLGHYSIGCMHPDFFGRGIFTALTRAGMNELCASSDWIEGPTHIENHAVQRGYLRLGWQLAGAQHSFHKWLQA